MTLKYWFIFYQDSIVMQQLPDGTCTIPYTAEPPVALGPESHILTISPMDDGTPVRAYSIGTPLSPDQPYITCRLRQSYYHLPTHLYLQAGKCRELLYWDEHTHSCGVCGAPM